MKKEHILLRVHNKFRTNKLAKIPGGSIITVKFKGKSPLEYDNIKNPKKYAEKILDNLKQNGEISSLEYILEGENVLLYWSKIEKWKLNNK